MVNDNLKPVKGFFGQASKAINFAFPDAGLEDGNLLAMSVKTQEETRKRF